MNSTMNGVVIQGVSTRELERRLADAPSSPLFARLASALLSHGETARAEALCERGIELFPRYTTGRIVYARCLAARGRYMDALRALEAVTAGYPGNLMLADLEELWRSCSERETGTVVADDGAVFTDLPADAPAVEIVDTTESIETVEPEIAPGAGTIVVLPAPADIVEAPAESAADPAGLSAGQVDPMDEFSVDPPSPVPTRHAGTVPILTPVPASLSRMSFIEQDRIISRTLAEIYANQGAITEAVVTYRLLLERMPERNERLEARLKELEERMRTDPGPRPGGVE